MEERLENALRIVNSYRNEAVELPAAIVQLTRLGWSERGALLLLDPTTSFFMSRRDQ